MYGQAHSSEILCALGRLFQAPQPPLVDCWAVQYTTPFARANWRPRPPSRLSMTQDESCVGVRGRRLPAATRTRSRRAALSSGSRRDTSTTASPLYLRSRVRSSTPSLAGRRKSASSRTCHAGTPVRRARTTQQHSATPSGSRWSASAAGSPAFPRAARNRVCLRDHPGYKRRCCRCRNGTRVGRGVWIFLPG